MPSEFVVDGDTATLRCKSRLGWMDVLVDTDKLHLVKDHAWQVQTLKRSGKTKYATRSTRQGTIYMHRHLFSECPDGMVCDHINGNKIDNRSQNIRFVSSKHNCLNRSGRTFLPGVQRTSYGNRYFGRISLYTGSYDTQEEAYQAWRELYEKYRGELPPWIDDEVAA